MLIVFAELAIERPTGSTWDKPPVAAAWTGSTRPTGKPSKTFTSTRWSVMPGNDFAIPPGLTHQLQNLRVGSAHTLCRIPFATDHTMTAARRDLFCAAADTGGGLSFPATTYPTGTPNPNGISRWDAFPGIVPRAVPSQTTRAETVPLKLAVLHP